MHPRDCPPWEYRDHPDSSRLIVEVLQSVLVHLRSPGVEALGFVSNTRTLHRQLFSRLIPDGYDYYAGNYRGSDFRCLKYRPVGVQGDLRVGYAPEDVGPAMNQLEQDLRSGIIGLDEGFTLPNAKLSRQTKLYFLVVFVSRLFVQFLTIHPYVNGNGHIARLMVWAVLGRYGYWPKRWPIEPRTEDPEYIKTIRAYRNGQPQRLENYILKCIAAPVSS
jgi:hypothetical protein